MRAPSETESEISSSAASTASDDEDGGESPKDTGFEDDDDDDEVGYRALSGVCNELTPMFSQEESGPTTLALSAGVEKFARHHKEDQGVGGAPAVEGSS